MTTISASIERKLSAAQRLIRTSRYDWKYRETRQNQLITATIDRLKSTERAQVREMEISLESLEKSSPTKSLSICVSGNLSRDILVDEFDCKT